MTGNWVLKIKKTNGFNISKICRKKDIKTSGNYYLIYYVDKPKDAIKKLKKIKVDYTCYRVEYERASNYRQTFFARTKGPYRCRYCNKKLPSKDKVYVDHIVPVAKTQKSFIARKLLSFSKCNNVNDIKNLAPACRDCNLKKSDKLGLWILRGWLGKYKSYWVSLYVLQILLILFAIIGVAYIMEHANLLNM